MRSILTILGTQQSERMEKLLNKLVDGRDQIRFTPWEQAAIKIVLLHMRYPRSIAMRR